MISVGNNCAPKSETEHSFNVSIKKIVASNYNSVLTLLKSTSPVYSPWKYCAKLLVF